MSHEILPFRPKFPEKQIPGVGTLVRKPLEIDDLPGKSENSHKVFRPTGIYIKTETGEQILLGWNGPVKVILNFVQKHGYTQNGLPSGNPVDGRGQTEFQMRQKFDNEIRINRQLAEESKTHKGFWPFPKILSETKTFHERSFTIESASMTYDGHDVYGLLFFENDFRISTNPELDMQQKQAFSLLHVRDTLRNLELLHSFGIEHGDFSFVNSPLRGSRTFLIDLGDSQRHSLPNDFRKDRNYFASLVYNFSELTRLLTKSPMDREAYANYKKHLSHDAGNELRMQLGNLTSIDVDEILQPLLQTLQIAEDTLGELFEREKYRYIIARKTQGKTNVNSQQIDALLKGIAELENTP